MQTKLAEFCSDGNGFTILLSHRPELFDTYANHDLDLILSGHAHGGQFRIPFIGGVVAPNQGFFPKFDAGIYTDGDTNMLVSRGVGNSIFPFRVNNRPEIILIELKSSK
jgi:predicted MPP superfamily phosphohydrolase